MCWRRSIRRRRVRGRHRRGRRPLRSERVITLDLASRQRRAIYRRLIDRSREVKARSRLALPDREGIESLRLIRGDCPGAVHDAVDVETSRRAIKGCDEVSPGVESDRSARDREHRRAVVNPKLPEVVAARVQDPTLREVSTGKNAAIRAGATGRFGPNLDREARRVERRDVRHADVLGRAIERNGSVGIPGDGAGLVKRGIADVDTIVDVLEIEGSGTTGLVKTPVTDGIIGQDGVSVGGRPGRSG